jgi:acetylornithine deacetylase/succinyl-diaminopimelate desuccinylase-like protein
MTGAREEPAAVVDREFDRYVGELCDLCRIPSVSAWGAGLDEAAQYVAERMLRAGIAARVVRGGGPPVVLGELRGGRAGVDSGAPTLMFYNHYDVQPPDPTSDWAVDPFGGEVRDGTLIARGAADNKGGLMSRIQAVEAYVQARGRLPLSVKFVVEGEEEIGSLHLKATLDAERRALSADGGLWESGHRDKSGRAVVYLGAKGICYLELAARGAPSELHSANAAVAPNPAWRLVWALASLLGPDGRVRAPGFYDGVRPPGAADRAALQALPFEAGAMQKQFGLKDEPEGAAFLERLLFEPSCCICGLESGYVGPGSKTVLPNVARALIDIRLVEGQDPARIEELLRRHLVESGFGDIEVSGGDRSAAARTPRDAAIVEATCRAAREVYGQDAVVYPTMAGSGPLPLFVDDLGIPMASLGAGHAGSAIHAPNENVRLEDYRLAIFAVQRVMDHFAACGRPGGSGRPGASGRGGASRGVGVG